MTPRWIFNFANLNFSFSIKIFVFVQDSEHHENAVYAVAQTLRDKGFVQKDGLAYLCNKFKDVDKRWLSAVCEILFA